MKEREKGGEGRRQAGHLAPSVTAGRGLNQTFTGALGLQTACPFLSPTAAPSVLALSVSAGLGGSLGWHGRASAVLVTLCVVLFTVFSLQMKPGLIISIKKFIAWIPPAVSMKRRQFSECQIREGRLCWAWCLGEGSPTTQPGLRR